MVLIESTGFLNIVFLTCDGVAESGAVQKNCRSTKRNYVRETIGPVDYSGCRRSSLVCWNVVFQIPGLALIISDDGAAVLLKLIIDSVRVVSIMVDTVTS